MITGTGYGIRELEANTMTAGTILVVDDEPSVLHSLTRLLAHRYLVVPCANGMKALELFSPDSITAVVSDVRMPGMSGLDLIRQIHEISPDIPVILMTAHGELDTVVLAVKQKAFDFILKPFKPDDLFDAVARAVRSRRDIAMQRDLTRLLRDEVQEKGDRLKEAQGLVKDMSIEVVQRLTNAAECRDSATGSHIVRIGQYAHHVAVELGLGEERSLEIAVASQMHDIGKLGIPDSILLKPGPLTVEEFETMKTHTIIGEQILRGSRFQAIKTAAVIALTHHERWDGGGYPCGLKGEEIPLEGQIVLLCDRYDALRSKRPYKPQFTHEETVNLLIRGDGRTIAGYFAPGILKVFRRIDFMFDLVYDCH